MELRNVPIRDWPERASSYAKDDAKITRDLYMDQLARSLEPAKLIKHTR